MKIGYAATFQNWNGELSDADVYKGELALAKLAEPLDFDSVWCVEHHFSGYQMVPEPIAFLSYMAGACPKLELGTMCIVLPWHQPIRVAEHAILLDHLSNGRFSFGLARGAGTVEFKGIGADQNVARGTFIEGATMVLEALETGIAEFDGEFVKQSRVELRPRPIKSFKGRTYVGSVSPESFDMMARMGLGVLITPNKPWDVVAKELGGYREKYREIHGAEAPPTIATGWVFCDEDEGRAFELGSKYIKGYWKTVLDFYGFNRPEQFKDIKGYEYYEEGAKIAAQMKADDIAEDFMKMHVWGTPEQCFEKMMAVREQVGCTAYNMVFRYADMPFEEAERNMRLFAREVMPQLKKVPDPQSLMAAA